MSVSVAARRKRSDGRLITVKMCVGLEEGDEYQAASILLMRFS